MKFALGVGLIIGAYLIGWAVPAILVFIMKNKVRAGEIGFGLWLFSWVPFFIGGAIAGKEGIIWVKQKLHLKSKDQKSEVRSQKSEKSDS
ncbi:MAG: hypothetical protein ACE14V_14715 [bacterium]